MADDQSPSVVTRWLENQSVGTTPEPRSHSRPFSRLSRRWSVLVARLVTRARRTRWSVRPSPRVVAAVVAALSIAGGWFFWPRPTNEPTETAGVAEFAGLDDVKTHDFPIEEPPTEAVAESPTETSRPEIEMPDPDRMPLLVPPANGPTMPSEFSGRPSPFYQSAEAPELNANGPRFGANVQPAGFEPTPEFEAEPAVWLIGTIETGSESEIAPAIEPSLPIRPARSTRPNGDGELPVIVPGR